MTSVLIISIPKRKCTKVLLMGVAKVDTYTQIHVHSKGLYGDAVTPSAASKLSVSNHKSACLYPYIVGICISALI